MIESTGVIEGRQLVDMPLLEVVLDSEVLCWREGIIHGGGRDE